MDDRRASRIAAVAFVLAAVSAGIAPAETEPGAPPEFQRVHADPAAAERAIVDAVLAFVRSDADAADAALTRVDAACRRLRQPEPPAPESRLVHYDQAFHKTIEMSRGFLAAGNLEKAFDQFMWLQRGCRGCHEVAREEGRIPTKKPAAGE